MTFDLLFIVALAALVVGPKRAVEIGRDFGKWKTKLMSLGDELKSALDQELRDIHVKEFASPAPAREENREELQSKAG